MCIDCMCHILGDIAEYLEELDNVEFAVQQNPDKVSPLRLQSIEEGYDAISMRDFLFHLLLLFFLTCINVARVAVVV